MPQQNLLGIQALRGAAAILVVLYHAIEAWNHTHAHTIAWPNGAAGVDIFFVISGFVMTLSARRLGEAHNSWRRFAAHRLRRIVPLYWIVSLAKIAAVAAAPALALRTKLTLPYIAASFLFLPLHDATGAFKPLLPVGWTLTFEMLFYGLFAAGLKLRMPTPLCVIPPLVVLAFLPHHPASVAGELCNPILLEFAFGIIIAEAAERGRVLAPNIALPLLAAATAMILLVPTSIPGGRLVAFGVPAAIIVSSLVSLEPRIAPLMPRALRHLGDASYAIYLTHGFAIAALVPTLPMLARMTGAGLSTWLVCTPLASALAGYAVHAGMEKPLLQAMKTREFRRVGFSPPAPHPSPATAPR